MADKSWGQAEHVLGMVGGLNYEKLRARVDSGILGDVLSEKVLVERFSDPAVRRAIRVSLGLEQVGSDDAKVVVASPVVAVPPTPRVYPVTFVPDLTWKERIERTGCSIDPEIWQYVDEFPKIEDEDPAPIDVLLHHFGVAISSRNAETGLQKAGLKQISPARYLHLLEQHPDLQRKFSLVHLKVACTAGRSRLDRVLYANESGRKRNLWLRCYRGDWYAYCRFPAARKQPLAA